MDLEIQDTGPLTTISLLPCVSAPTLSCEWSPYTDGLGDDETMIGDYSQAECANECISRSRLNPNINGATIGNNNGKCWCEIGMKSQVSDSRYTSCFFRGEICRDIAIYCAKEYLLSGLSLTMLWVLIF